MRGKMKAENMGTVAMRQTFAKTDEDRRREAPPSFCTAPPPCSASDEYVSTDWEVVMRTHGWPANVSALDEALTMLAKLQCAAEEATRAFHKAGIQMPNVRSDDSKRMTVPT
jgi:hypothetical protein